jgi:hypothetical protein
VEVTGIHAITTFSTTIEFDPEWTVSQVASYLHSNLSDSAQQLFELALPVNILGFSVFNSALVQQPSGHQRPITEVMANEKEKYLILFDLPSDHANIVETYIKDNKENLAIARGDRLVREEDELKAKKVKGKNKDEAAKSDTSSQMLKVLQRLDGYDDKLANQEREIGELQRMNEKLQRTNENLQKTIAGLSTKVARQTKILNALHRRVVLDQARDLIINRYGFKISDLRLGDHQNQTERQTKLHDLLHSVRSALNPEDSDLLSDDALQMIFDGAKNTIRDAGNEVAHQASTSDISLAVLEGSLTQKQSDALKKIYRFTHNQEPQLE